MTPLFLYEEVMLLALRDEEGTFTEGFVEYAVSGAILAELLIMGHIFLADDRRKLVDHNDPPLTGDPIIDECQGRITGVKRRAALTNWIPRLARTPNLRKKVAQRLCEHGIVRADEDKVLFLFSRTIYPEINPEPEREIMARLKEAIFSDSEDLDPRTMTLISIAHRTGLLKQNLGDKEIHKHRKRIEQIIEGEAIGAAAGNVLGMDSTATAVSFIPALIAGSASS